MTAFAGRFPSNPVKTLMRSDQATLASASDAKIRRLANTQKLIASMKEQKQILHDIDTENPDRAREHNSKGRIPNAMEEDNVILARHEFFEGKKMCLHWRSPRKILKALSDFVFDFKDLRSGKNNRFTAQG